MEAVPWNYLQFRKAQDYPVYVRIEAGEEQSKLLHLLHETGFVDLTDKESRKISLERPGTRILTIQPAGSRVQQQIDGSSLLDKFGHEALSLRGNIPVYTYRRVGMMALPLERTLWDLAINNEILQTDQMVGLRIVLTRFLAFAMASAGLISYWGTVKDETVIVMKQADAFGEAVFIDSAKKMVYWNGGEMRLGPQLKFLRKDKEQRGGRMSREEIISFLSVSTCLLSFTGITPQMKRSIYDLSSRASATYAAHESALNL